MSTQTSIIDISTFSKYKREPIDVQQTKKPSALPNVGRRRDT